MADDPFAQYARRPAAPASDDPFSAYARREPARPDFRTSNERDASGRPVVSNHPHARTARWLGETAAGIWENANPLTIAKGLYQAARHPIDTGTALVGAQVEQARKARAALGGVLDGDDPRPLVERLQLAAGHTGAAILPVLGPVAADLGERIGEGEEIPRNIGRGIGVVLPLGAAAGAVKAGAQGVARRIPPRGRLRTQLPAESVEAVRWALEQGIPVDAATASGNPVVGMIKAGAESTVGGALPAQAAKRAREAAMARTGQRIASQVDAAPATAESAGTAVREGVESAIKREAEAADTFYGRVRAAERVAQPDDVPVASGTEPMQFAVPLASAKDALRPVYERLMRKKELTGQLMGDEGRAAVALDAIIGGPDHAPLSVVDAALGDLKSAARGAALPELRTNGQGLAAQAVSELESLVQARAKDAGVWDDLRAGRDATIRKWTAAETLDKLKSEPVQTFRALTSQGDAAISRLREVKRVAPAELPKIGRAYLEGLLDDLAVGVKGDKRAWLDWEKLGPETKSMLYPDKALRTEIDHFFRIGKQMADNPNPSGSAKLILAAGSGFALADPVTGAVSALGSAALTKLLNSPKTARLLVEGLQTPATAPAARSLAARLRQAVTRAGVAQAQAQQAAQRDPASPSGRPAVDTR